MLFFLYSQNFTKKLMGIFLQYYSKPIQSHHSSQNFLRKDKKNACFKGTVTLITNYPYRPGLMRPEGHIFDPRSLSWLQNVRLNWLFVFIWTATGFFMNIKIDLVFFARYFPELRDFFEWLYFSFIVYNSGSTHGVKWL